VIHFEEDFSHNLFKRMIEMTAADLSDKNAIDWNVINGSSIGISMDVTNQHIAFTLQLKFVEAFQQFMEQLVTSCDISKAIATVPLVFETPIYGNNELTFTHLVSY